MDSIFLSIIILIGFILFLVYVLQCERCFLYQTWYKVQGLSENYINFENETEKLAFCQAIGTAVESCSKNNQSAECRNFNESVSNMKKNLDVLFEIYNRNVKNKEI